jgi:uncharacterized protein DUF3306
VSDEKFLSRWSRRKQQARRREPDREPATSASPQPDSDNPAVAEPDITAEELARLPPVEELTPHSDLTQFLRKGVPVALRNAALRRVWAFDPKIRDYVGEARDYAYDWNAPAGVPGSGPLDERDIEGLLRRVIGDAEPGPHPASPQPAPEAGPGSPPGAEASTEAPPPSGEPSPAEPDRSVGPETPLEAAPAGRRHGGAMPV